MKKYIIIKTGLVCYNERNNPNKYKEVKELNLSNTSPNYFLHI